MRFFVVSLAALGMNLLVLELIVGAAGTEKVSARQSRSSSSRRSTSSATSSGRSGGAGRSVRPVRRSLFFAVVLLALAAAPAAFAAGGTTTPPVAPVYDAHGRLIQTPFVPRQVRQRRSSRGSRRSTSSSTTRRSPRGCRAIPSKGARTDETYASAGQQWTIDDLVGRGRPVEIAQGIVFDPTGAVTEAWTGPQVAWGMARGMPGAFGGTAINDPWVWGAFCLVFLLGLGDWRRPFSLRNLDLLFLLSPTASLWYFNEGNVFAAVPLFYPCLDLGRAARDLDRDEEPRHAGRPALAGLGPDRRRRSSSSASASGSTSSARTSSTSATPASSAPSGSSARGCRRGGTSRRTRPASEAEELLEDRHGDADPDERRCASA